MLAMVIDMIKGILLKIFEVLLGRQIDQARDMEAFPNPFECASENTSEAVLLLTTDGGYGLDFDFKKLNPAGSNPFVSLVYRFSDPVSLKRIWGLTFSLIASVETPDRFDIEIKNEKLETCASESFRPQVNKTGNVIQLIPLEWKFDEHDKTNLKNAIVKEICFVVKPPFCIDKLNAKGKLEITSLTAHKKTLFNQDIKIT